MESFLSNFCSALNVTDEQSCHDAQVNLIVGIVILSIISVSVVCTCYHFCQSKRTKPVSELFKTNL